MASVPSSDPGSGRAAGAGSAASGRPVRRLGRWRAGLVRWLRFPGLASRRRGPAEAVAPGLVGGLSIRPPWALLTRLRRGRLSSGQTGGPAGDGTQIARGPARGVGSGPARAVPGPGELLRASHPSRPQQPRHRPLVGSRPGFPGSDPVVRADLDLPVVPVVRTVAAPTVPPPTGTGVGPAGYPRTTPARSGPSAGPGPVASRITRPGATPVIAGRGALSRTAGDPSPSQPPGPGQFGTAGRLAAAGPLTSPLTSPLASPVTSPLASPVTGPLAGPARTSAGGAAGPGHGGLVRRPATLATRPPAGPEIRPPHSASDLPVLGGGVAAPGTAPDPTGAVRLSTPPRPAFALAPRGVAGGAAPGGSTPRQRWEAAVAARPLEAPQPLPSGLHPLARLITGRTGPPRFTTGPATRHALAAAGALGATTGTVVHLAAVPTGRAAASVLAHELAHTRHPVRRPRFLLSGDTGLLDDDERQALAAGRDLLAGDRTGGADTIGAGIVDRLPVGGGLGAVRELVTQTTQAVIEAMPQIPAGAVPGTTPGPAGTATSTGPSGPAAAGAPAGEPVPGWEQGGTAGWSAAAPPAVAGAPPGGAGAGDPPSSGTALDPDQVVAIVEERLLREIERRGGRWAGVF